LLIASGAGALNQCVERRFDAQMRRTARRPLAAGRLDPTAVLCFGILLSAAGALYLAVAVNALASLLAISTLTAYLFIYTPLKRKTSLCMLIGAFPGAAPPLIGWAAARGRLDPEACVLFALVFFWQFPHFMAIAWMYREDYTRAGYIVLPKGARQDPFVISQSLLFSLFLIPFTLIPMMDGKPGRTYFAGVLLLGLTFSYLSGRFAFYRSKSAARRLLAASIVYLPSVLILEFLNKK
jgi:protoheme IX farnesyltransferase